jgi:hypothetical protein
MKKQHILVLAAGLFAAGIAVAGDEALNLAKYPMLKAIMDNDLEKVKKLVRSGLDVNKEYDGMTVLEAAIASEASPEIVELLLKNKANVNVNKALVSLAVRSAWDDKFISRMQQHKNVIRMLLDQGADVFERSTYADGYSAYDLVTSYLNTLSPERLAALKKQPEVQEIITMVKEAAKKQKSGQKVSRRVK